MPARATKSSRSTSTAKSDKLRSAKSKSAATNNAPEKEPRDPKLDKAKPQDGFLVGHQNRAIGIAQARVVKVLRRWLREKHGIEGISELATYINGPKGTISASAISHVFAGRANLPLRHLGAWTGVIARDAWERKALRTLFALASTHEAVLNLFDWKAEVTRLERELWGE
jgi:hypothetical protein